MHGNLSRDEARAAVRLVERVLSEEAGSAAEADQERFRHVTMEPSQFPPFFIEQFAVRETFKSF